jgi:hypothetical protein
MRSERPCGSRAANNLDEVAPPSMLKGVRMPQSALDQKRTFEEICVMSALPPKADID